MEKEDRADIVALYDTFKIEASSRKTLRELTTTFIGQQKETQEKVAVLEHKQ